ncbi:LysR family transcriptional regulator [Pseudonocardia humida]|uniref:LysR family transcriptional regulator n=1 Tax=Pseudonocardia humida TaxID=2800819 RepID=A0ABT1A7K2_9PSEU|nr:LysR family transcriptional regulator [Pseudonocardia humida]MCO1658940.1 LysR family transcriptional regulator [Pseudonocardia humida]
MDTRLLRTFLVLARTGSFTATAAELHVVQSTVTGHVQALERRLGTRLFDRLPGGARLTDAGRRVAGPARDLLDDQQRLLDAAGAGGAPAGEVTIGATESVCAYRLPPVIAALAARQPGVRVHLTPAGTAAALGALTGPDGRLDIALLLDDDLPGDLPARRIGREPIEVVGAAGHPATDGPRSWAQLAEQPWFLLEEGCSYTDRFVRELAAGAPAHPRITRFGSIEAVRSCVAAGLGLAVLPRVAVAAGLADGSLRRVAGVPRPDVPLSLLTDHRRRPSAAVAAVASAVESAAANW